MRTLMEEGNLEGPPADLMQPRPEEELYDTVSDPHEINNLAGDPAYDEVLLAMRTALDTWMVETGDLGVWPEPDSIVAPFVDEMHNWFGTPAWAEVE